MIADNRPNASATQAGRLFVGQAAFLPDDGRDAAALRVVDRPAAGERRVIDDRDREIFSPLNC